MLFTGGEIMKVNYDLDEGIFVETKVYLNHPKVVAGSWIFLAVLIAFLGWVG
jgi:hypothetical protein